MKKTIAFLLVLLVPALSYAGEFRLKPGFLKAANYQPTLLFPCWNGVFANFSVQYQAYYEGSQGSFFVMPTEQTKHGLSMLLTFDPKVMKHDQYGDLKYIKIEYKDKPDCKSGWDNFTK